MTSYVTPKKNAQYIFYVSLVSQANTKLMQVNPTLAAADFNVSGDGGGLGALGTTPTVTPAAGRMVKVTLSNTEMNFDNVTLVCSDAAGAEWCDLVVNIQTSARQVDDLAYPATSGRSMVVDANGLVDANAVKVGPTGAGTAQTAGDIIGDTNDIQARLPAALTANGNMKSSLMEILTTALTETVGQLAGGFKKFFNIAAPTSTMDLITAVTTVTSVTNRVTANTDQIEGVDATNQIRDSIVTDATRFAGANIDAAITSRASAAALATVQADTDDIQTRLPAALTIDGNIKADTLRVGGTLQTAGDIIGDTNDIQARLPAALTIDGNIKADTLRVGGTLQTAGDIIGDTNDIQARLPAALVGGRMDSDVSAISTDTVAADNAEKFFDGTGYAGTNNVIPTVTTVTNDVGITQTGADKVWASAARTLTSFGTLIADIWANASRTLTAFGFSVTAGTVSDKTGYTVTTADKQAAADEFLNRNLAGGGSGGARIVRDALRVLRNRRKISAGTLTVYAEDDATPAWTAPVTTAPSDPVNEIDPA